MGGRPGGHPDGVDRRVAHRGLLHERHLLRGRGRARPSPRFAPLVEQWNGTAWAVVTTPNLATTGDTALSGVSCRSSAFCMAVGYQNGDTQTLAEMWNGTTWTVVASPNDPAGTVSEFHSVSCAGTRFCAAVGESRGGSITASSDNLVALWGGSAFTMSPAPNPSAGFGGALSGVSCFSATSCTAVGQTYLNGGSLSDTQGSDLERPVLDHRHDAQRTRLDDPEFPRRRRLPDRLGLRDRRRRL